MQIFVFFIQFSLTFVELTIGRHWFNGGMVHWRIYASPILSTGSSPATVSKDKIGNKKLLGFLVIAEIQLLEK